MAKGNRERRKEIVCKAGCEVETDLARVSAKIKNARGWLAPGRLFLQRLFDAGLVDVVLLPVEGGVGLDDDVFVGGLLEFVDEHGFARF
jgi:hypothetical protein